VSPAPLDLHLKWTQFVLLVFLPSLSLIAVRHNRYVKAAAGMLPIINVISICWRFTGRLAPCVAWQFRFAKYRAGLYKLGCVNYWWIAAGENVG